GVFSAIPPLFCRRHGNINIDYERFGRNISLDESGTFTAQGYIRNNGYSFVEDYDGINVPEKHKVFSLPKP
ncbi:MAG: hypothetical protein RR581_08355, partial [Eubacterium sp.]